MLKCLNLVLGGLIVETPKAGRSIKPMEILSHSNNEFDENAKHDWSEKKIKSARLRILQSAIALCLAINIRIYDRYGDDDGQLTYTYTLSKNKIYYARKQVKEILNIAKSISDRVEKTQCVNFIDLLSCCGNRVDQKKLTAALRLLANLGICSNKQNLLSQSYILCLKTIDSLNPDVLTEHEQETVDVLKKCNAMAPLRSHAMELYARLPAEYRKKYIDDYFTVTNPQDMERFIANTVDEVGSDDQELQEILSSVRGFAMKEALDELHPEKRPVCERPYRDKFLVNAGPGAGKTRVLMMRCAHLIHHQGLAPDEILVLAFNRAVVYEIRERIIELFNKLRYGSYVKRLHVYTFHAFAKRAMKANNIGDEDDLNNLLHSFAERLKTDEQFRNEVGERYKAILIDEFQDMNDDFYDVITSLQRASNAGLMVIGDDDQDILLWNRLQNGQRLRLHAVDYFEQFRCYFTNNNTENLVFNFRSCREIVDRSQKYLNLIMAKLTTKKRLKTEILLKANPENKKEAIVQDETSLEDFIKIIPGELAADKEIAILCRTNGEVFSVYKKVIEETGINRSDIKIQNKNDLWLSDIREYAEWLDICRRKIIQYGDAPITHDLYNELITNYRNLNLPQDNMHLISQLWEITNSQFRNPTLQIHTEFIEDLCQSDFERLKKRHDKPSYYGRLVISTIHKVKGLEFDTVFIKPSSVSFPLEANGESPKSCNINDYAAEEARLFYVAMTRAKSGLYFQWGERERKWFGLQNYAGKQEKPYLEGKHEEVFLSWPGFNKPQYETGLQDYIKKKVSVDDRISIKNRAIIHGKMKIGLLASTVKIKTWDECVVHAIIRSPVDEKLKLKYAEYYNQIHPFLKEQGWLYTVLVRST
jgi:superfamily I DNA/RNA helicase